MPSKAICILAQNVIVPLPCGVLVYFENMADRPAGGMNYLRNTFLPFQKSLTPSHKFNQDITDAHFDKLSSKMTFC